MRSSIFAKNRRFEMWQKLFQSPKVAFSFSGTGVTAALEIVTPVCNESFIRLRTVGHKTSKKHLNK